MKNIRMSLWFGLAAMLVTVSFLATNASAQTAVPLTAAKLKANLVIIGLRANTSRSDAWFIEGDRVGFTVNLRLNHDSFADGVDIGVYHNNGSQPIAYKENQRLYPGQNEYGMELTTFRGDPGGYVVKVRYHSADVATKLFATRKKVVTYYTIDPFAPFPRLPGFPGH